MKTMKQESVDLIRNLPEDFSLDEILYEIDGLEAFIDGEAAVERGDYITQAELEERVRGWRESSGRRALPRVSNE